VSAATVFIESNTTGTGRLFARRAIALGFVPVIVAADPRRYPFIGEDRIATVSCDTADPDALGAAVESIHRTTPVAGIYSTSEYFVAAAAVLARARRLPGADPAAIAACRNKAVQRERMSAARVPVPKFAHVVEPAAIAATLARMPSPVVVKPASGTGSVGVRLCRTREEATAHIESLLAVRVNERGLPVVPGVVVEEYVTGLEYSVELLGQTVVGITRKHLSPEPYFVETGHDFPAALTPRMRTALEDTARRAIAALGLDWGPAHVELRYSGDGAVVIEVNPRLAGGFIPELVRLATGVDLIDETLALVVGRARPLRRCRRWYASIRFVVAAASGRIGRIPEWRDPGEGGLEVAWYRQPGDHVQVQHDFRDRLGHVISHSPERVWSARRADAALRQLVIETQPC
jgi:S-sulfo-L-cysteine synthase (3-phospho-L-serine-dependent)